MPVDIASGPASPGSTACSIGVSAPSSSTIANANGRSSGWAFTGCATQVQVWTTPSGPTSTKSVGASCETGSNSGGGQATRPSASRAPRMVRWRSPVMNLESTGPRDRV